MTTAVLTASATSPVPISRAVITPASVAAPALSRLLPNRMTPSRRSVLASSAMRELGAVVAALRAMLAGDNG